jgi:hypothetical protein
MRYAEAFKKLGYDLPNPRQHWSCSGEKGVCLSLWHKEIDWKNRKFDTKEDAGPPEGWSTAGAKQRIRDLKLAMEKFGGWVDVVVVKGVPGQGVDNANPWLPNERQGQRWRVTTFEESTGHFRAEMTGAVTK